MDILKTFLTSDLVDFDLFQWPEIFHRAPMIGDEIESKGFFLKKLTFDEPVYRAARLTVCRVVHTHNGMDVYLDLSKEQTHDGWQILIHEKKTGGVYKNS